MIADSLTTNVQVFSLAVMYLIAAGLRLWAAQRNDAVRKPYLFSVFLAVVISVSYVWVLFGQDTMLRTTLVRFLGLLVVPVVWIWPTLAVFRTPPVKPVQRRERDRVG